MDYKLNQKVMQQVESKILEHYEGDASIIEYDDSPYDVNDDILFYGYSVELNANVISTIIVSGEQLDVDRFDRDSEYNIGCIVTGTTKTSESALISVNATTGEIIVQQIKPAKFSDVADIEIDDRDGLDDIDYYMDEVKDQGNWDEDYINDLTIKQFNFSMNPEELFVK